MCNCRSGYFCSKCETWHPQPGNWEEVAHLVFPHDSNWRRVTIAYGKLAGSVEELRKAIKESENRHSPHWLDLFRY